MNIKEYLEGQRFPFRSDCPECGHKNTFSADVVDGVILYHCYHASCRVKGRVKYGIGIQDIRKLGNSSCMVVNDTYKIGANFTNPLQNSRCLSFMQHWGIIRAYVEGKVDVRYDPKQSRCVFILKDLQGKIKGSTGRSLDGQPPKWFIYERFEGCPGFVLSKETSREKLILVEDMISACVASEYINAVALLGTNIPNETIVHLLPFKEIFIALDPDALDKAIKLQNLLSIYRQTKIISINQDIKYYKKEQLEELFNEISNS